MNFQTEEFYLGDKVARGSRLHGLLKGKPLVIFGNAPSLNRMDLDKLTCFPTLGCNRILRLFQPDIYTVCDRQPYMQDIELIKAYRGIRLLSCTLFDPVVSCRRMPVQPIPDFEWYRYRAVASGNPMRFPGHRSFVLTSFTNDQRVHTGRLPAVQTNLDQFMPSGANIGYCMVQQAIALGANPIGIAGIDLPPDTEWKQTKATHFFGDGRKVGAFAFNSPRVMKFMEAAADFALGAGVQIFNLSPEGYLNCFERMSEYEFHNRFEKHADRESLRPRQLREFVADPDRKLVELPPLSGRQPTPPHRSRRDRPGFLVGGGLVGTRDGTESRKSLQERIADIQRSRLSRRSPGGKA